MAASDLPTPDTLRQLLRYDPDTGKLFWIYRPGGSPQWNGRYANKEAFTADNGHGYLGGDIFCCKHKAHRVVWAMHYGEWPTNQIDHINGVKSDNRICNLRSVTNQENQRNSPRPANNKSGAVGVFWHKTQRKWKASISVDGRRVHLGGFDTLDDAIRARKSAEVAYGYHPNHGRLAICQ